MTLTEEKEMALRQEAAEEMYHESKLTTDFEYAFDALVEEFEVAECASKIRDFTIAMSKLGWEVDIKEVFEIF